jgi:hypothetical protein
MVRRRAAAAGPVTSARRGARRRPLTGPPFARTAPRARAGEKKLRSLITRTVEWSDADARHALVRRARPSQAPAASRGTHPAFCFPALRAAP